MAGSPRGRITPFGDAALMVTFGDEIDPALNEHVHRLAAAVRRLAATDTRFGQPVPAFASVLVPTDPRAAGPEELIDALSEIVREATRTTAGPAAGPAPEPRRHEIPARYGGVDGPDLDVIAAMRDLTAKDVVELHASVDYRVYMLGFAPGFAYLGRVPSAIATPRRSTPRQRVPAGSVAIGRDQTGVYPFATPAGWHVIGRTGVRLWDPAADQPALLAPGDTVRFVPIR
jgi:KipI family sensor histidine kinase inhibitor